MSAGVKKTWEGVVTRRSGDKTVVVEVQRFVRDPLVKKYVRRRQRFHVHDAKNVGAIGDVVTIRESRPLSATKRWILQAVVKRGTVAELPAEFAGS